MKNIKLLLGLATVILTYSCSSTYNTTKTNPDDVYYSSKNAPPPPAVSNNDNGSYQSGNTSSQNDSYTPGQNSSTSEQSTDGNGNTYVTNNYNGDYYDYEYSSRIRRYYEPAGYGYYDPFYTNSYYYDYNPSSWGLSIYLGYNWWAPSSFYYDPFCYGGFSAGYGYNPYYGYSHYHPFYSPFYQPYNPYAGSYYHGYMNGYNDGYYAGNPNPYYYNSYDNSSYYYGPRGSVSSNSPRSSNQRQSQVAPIGQKFEQAISQGRVSRINSGLNKSDLSAPQQRTSVPGRTIQNQRENTPVRNESIPSKDNSGRLNNSIKNSTTPSIRQDNHQNEVIKQEQIRGNENQIKQNDDTRGRISKDRSKPAINNNSENRQQRNDIQNVPESKPQQNERIDNKPLRNEIQNNSDRPKSNTYNYERENRVKPKEDSKIEMPARQERRTPVFQPRDEPKQFRQESTPSFQRSQPSVPSNNSNTGGRRK